MPREGHARPPYIRPFQQSFKILATSVLPRRGSKGGWGTAVPISLIEGPPLEGLWEGWGTAVLHIYRLEGPSLEVLWERGPPARVFFRIGG